MKRGPLENLYVKKGAMGITYDYSLQCYDISQKIGKIRALLVGNTRWAIMNFMHLEDERFYLLPSMMDNGSLTPQASRFDD